MPRIWRIATNQTQSGFTLVELLLYVSIASIILLAISGLLSVLLHARIKNQTIADVEQQGVVVMQEITQVLHNASDVDSPTIGTSASSLSVHTYTAGNNPTVLDLSSGVLRIKEGANAFVPLTNTRVTASNFTVQNLSHTGTPGTVRIQFTLDHVNPEGRNEYSYSKIFIGSATLRQP
ncbi:MAG: prepilin-type N-terminal cleavage/methylation domain-containing protein [bacterium]|nr:prepilin-type N-terminal cleavage/methylation domain-containing protein [bacterium]